MEHLTKEEFDYHYGGNFVLTDFWSPLGRNVIILRRAKSGSAKLAKLIARVEEDPPIPDNQDWSWEDSTPNCMPISSRLGKDQNDREVERATEKLQELDNLPDPIKNLPDVQRDRKFYERVLYTFWHWYQDHDLPFPTGTTPDEPPTKELKGHQIAREACPHLDEANTVADLWRKTYDLDPDLSTSTKKDDLPEGVPTEKNFLMHFKRQDFYPRDKDLSPRQRYDVMAERIRDFVESSPDEK